MPREQRYSRSLLTPMGWRVCVQVPGCEWVLPPIHARRLAMSILSSVKHARGRDRAKKKDPQPTLRRADPEKAKGPAT